MSDNEVRNVAHKMIVDLCMLNIPFDIAVESAIDTCNLILTDLEDKSNLYDKYKFWSAVKIELERQK